MDSAPGDYDTIRLTGFSIGLFLLFSALSMGIFNLRILYKAIKTCGCKRSVFLWIAFVLLIILTIITPLVVAGFALPGINNTIGVVLLTSIVYLALTLMLAILLPNKRGIDN